VGHVINPGARPLPDARENLAAANLLAFLAEVRVRAVELEEVPLRVRVHAMSGEPERAAGADLSGRFAWDVPFSNGKSVRVLIPGVPLPEIRDDLTAQAPCLYVGAEAAWWSDAVGSLANEGMQLR
jgi:hypothetical protein